MISAFVGEINFSGVNEHVMPPGRQTYTWAQACVIMAAMGSITWECGMRQDERATHLRDWVGSWLHQHRRDLGQPLAMPMVSGDASFRRYFRVLLSKGSLIAVDAPPAHENMGAFIAIASALRAHGVLAPEVIAVEHEQGYMLLSDLGDRLLLGALDEQRVDALYGQAMDEILRMQSCQEVPGWTLPQYDQSRLLDEMKLFPDWFVRRYLGLELSVHEHAVLDNAVQLIVEAVLQQPQGFVHRDYHARNLMLVEDDRLAVIDFQYAVIGPLSYDLISLLRDAYIAWPRARVQQWIAHFAAQAAARGLLDAAAQAGFAEDCDWMSAQRHLKVLGIFARLSLRDGKHGYLQDMPLVMAYLLDEVGRLPSLRPLHRLLQERIAPRYADQSGHAQVELR